MTPEPRTLNLLRASRYYYRRHLPDFDACVVGEPTSEQSAYFRAVFEAVETAIATIRPGGSTADVFAAAIEVPRAMGFADFERHTAELRR